MSPLYVLLGSNIGDRATWLASARAWIDKEVGIIRAASAVYETAAWGKEEQASFLNQALAVDVHPSLIEGRKFEEAALAVLAKTSAIEAAAGRERTEAWAARTLDIDLLLWGDAVVDEPRLSIPHPALPQRRFALVPLAEIADNAVHPVLGKTVTKMLEDCADALSVQRFEEAAAGKSGTEGGATSARLFPRLPPRHVAIEGVIGAGKTTLAQRLAVHYGVSPVLEAFTENPFLPRFYADPMRYALPVELHFLADRHRQLLGSGNTPSRGVTAERPARGPLVADYTFAKCRLFAAITLQPEEATLFNRLYAMAEAMLPQPDVLIYLDAPVARLQRSIRERGRDYEQSIPDSYLMSLAAAYEAWLPVSGLPVVWVDTAQQDYLSDARVMATLVELLESPLKPGIHAMKM